MTDPGKPVGTSPANGHTAREKFSGGPPEGRRGEVFVPAADVVESDAAFVILVDLPGLRPEAIDVRTERGTLTVTAERPAPPAAAGRMLASERVHGWYERSFALPSDVDAGRIEARYENGTLTLTLPKAEAAKPRLIEVKVSN